MSNHKDLQKLSASGLLISLGIIYGDIVTSPLNVLHAITGLNAITATLVLCGVFLFFTINTISPLFASNKSNFKVRAIVKIFSHPHHSVRYRQNKQTGWIILQPVCCIN